MDHAQLMPLVAGFYTMAAALDHDEWLTLRWGSRGPRALVFTYVRRRDAVEVVIPGDRKDSTLVIQGGAIRNYQEAQ